VDQALIGLAGVFVGAVGTAFTGAGKYFTNRRDAWIVARASGLILLADARATLASQSHGGDIDISPLLTSWQANRVILAGFRRGAYPSGFRASEWLALAAGFARLTTLNEVKQCERDARWQAAASNEARGVEALLDDFADDPKVFSSVLRTGAANSKKRLFNRVRQHEKR
jgi:hypothetical protein